MTNNMTHIHEPTIFSPTNTYVEREKKTAPAARDAFIPSGSTSACGTTNFMPKVSEDVIPSVIPPEHRNRTLVVCFDGTGDQFDMDNSNIIQFVSLLKKDDKSKQMVYYQTGIGTYTSPHVASPLKTKIYQSLDEAIAWNLDAHVMDGYEFLMQNYIAGDRICLFGFSRGAYTARSLAGMIHKVGLLPADNRQQVPFAYKMYTRADDIGWKQSDAFKKAFSIDVDIEFVGVWDTVDSVGMIPKRLPFTTSNTIVRTFRHALALDERRAKFKANIWNRPTTRDSRRGSKNESGDMWANLFISEEDRRLDKFESRFSKLSGRVALTDVEEVWFAGCHCDVGGGSVNNETRHSLARIPLRWMVRECFKTRTGIMFDSERLRAIGLDPSSLHPYVKPRPSPSAVGLRSIQAVPSEPSFMERLATFGRSFFTSIPAAIPSPVLASSSEGDEYYNVLSEEDEDLRDALSPIYDQLEQRPIWWLLEVLPLTFRYQKGNNDWVSYRGYNLGQPRVIHGQHTYGIKVHRTVKSRMEANPPEGKRKYVPHADIAVEPTWVD